jgi:hypothetical protein
MNHSAFFPHLNPAPKPLGFNPNWVKGFFLTPSFIFFRHGCFVPALPLSRLLSPAFLAMPIAFFQVCILFIVGVASRAMGFNQLFVVGSVVCYSAIFLVRYLSEVFGIYTRTIAAHVVNAKAGIALAYKMLIKYVVSKLNFSMPTSNTVSACIQMPKPIPAPIIAFTDSIKKVIYIVLFGHSRNVPTTSEKCNSYFNPLGA